MIPKVADFFEIMRQNKELETMIEKLS